MEILTFRLFSLLALHITASRATNEVTPESLIPRIMENAQRRITEDSVSKAEDSSLGEFSNFKSVTQSQPALIKIELERTLGLFLLSTPKLITVEPPQRVLIKFVKPALDLEVSFRQMEESIKAGFSAIKSSEAFTKLRDNDGAKLFMKTADQTADSYLEEIKTFVKNFPSSQLLESAEILAFSKCTLVWEDQLEQKTKQAFRYFTTQQTSNPNGLLNVSMDNVAAMLDLLKLTLIEIQTANSDLLHLTINKMSDNLIHQLTKLQCLPIRNMHAHPVLCKLTSTSLLCEIKVYSLDQLIRTSDVEALSYPGFMANQPAALVKRLDDDVFYAINECQPLTEIHYYCSQLTQEEFPCYAAAESSSFNFENMLNKCKLNRTNGPAIWPEVIELASGALLQSTNKVTRFFIEKIRWQELPALIDRTLAISFNQDHKTLELAPYRVNETPLIQITKFNETQIRKIRKLVGIIAHGNWLKSFMEQVSVQFALASSTFILITAALIKLFTLCYKKVKSMRVKPTLPSIVKQRSSKRERNVAMLRKLEFDLKTRPKSVRFKPSR